MQRLKSWWTSRVRAFGFGSQNGEWVRFTPNPGFTINVPFFGKWHWCRLKGTRGH